MNSLFPSWLRIVLPTISYIVIALIKLLLLDVIVTSFCAGLGYTTNELFSNKVVSKVATKSSGKCIRNNSRIKIEIDRSSIRNHITNTITWFWFHF